MEEDLIDISLISLMSYAAYKSYETQRKHLKPKFNEHHRRKTPFRWNIKQMLSNDPQKFGSLMRMKPNTFRSLQNIIKSRQEDSFCKLAITILYLAQGIPISVLSTMFSLSNSQVEDIIFKICNILWSALSLRYLKPITTEQQQSISNNFYDLCNIPNCVGALQSKTLQIKLETDEAIKIIACCDTKFKFSKIYVTSNENETNLEKLHEILLPKTELPFTNVSLPYYMVSDNIYSTKTFIVHPYTERVLNEKCRYFNQHILHILSFIENTFGILAARWKVLQMPLVMESEKAIKVTQTCMVLHNYLMVNDKSYCPKEYVDSYDKNGILKQRGLWRNEATPLINSGFLGSNNIKDSFENQRNILKDYVYIYKT